MFVDEKKAGEQRSVDATGRALLRMANYIERHGWCQGMLIDRMGRVCVIGALHFCNLPMGEDCVPVHRLYRYLNYTNVSTWNDAPGRTQEEVVRTLREAAYVR